MATTAAGKSPVTVVLVDTNVLWSGHGLNGKSLLELSSLARDGRVRVLVPEAVILELARHLCDADKKTRATMEKSLQSRHLIGHEQTPSCLLQEIDWEQALRQALGAFATIPPHPDIPHADLVMKDLAVEAPFKSNGSGYRDALIWATVCEAVEVGSTAVLVSANKSDFTKGEPIAALKRDLPQGTNVQILPTLEDLRRLLEGTPRPTRYYRDTTTPLPFEAIKVALTDESFYGEVRDVRVGRKMFVTGDVQHVHDWLNVWSTYTYGEIDEVFGVFNVEVIADVSMTGSAPRNKVAALDGDVGISFEPNDAEVALSFDRQVRMDVDIEYRLDNQEVAYVQINHAVFHDPANA